MPNVNQLYYSALQAQTELSGISLNQQKLSFFNGQLGTNYYQPMQAEIAYLRNQTGESVNHLEHLWRSFMVSRGVTHRNSIVDMKIDFFTNFGFFSTDRSAGFAMYFDGSDGSYLNRSNTGFAFTKTQEMTWMGWVNLTGDRTSSNQIIRKQTTATSGYNILAVRESNNLKIKFQEQKTNTAVSWGLLGDFANTWYHFAVTYDGTNEEVGLYINGNLIIDNKSDSIDWAEVTNDSSADLILGSSSSSDNLDGYLDDIVYTTSVLTQQQIRDHANDGTLPASYVAEWSFNEGTGTSSIIDGSSNGYDLTINGNTFYKSDDDIKWEDNANCYGAYFFENGVTDASQLNNLATVDGSPVYGNGIYNQGLELDGTDDRFKVPRNANLNQSSFSFMAWALFDDSGAQSFVDKNDYAGSWRTFKQADKTIRFDSLGGNNITDTTTKIGTNRWYHLALVHNGDDSTVDWYVDGQLDTAGTGKSAGNTANKDIFISNTFAGRMTGRVDRFFIFNDTLTPSEILKEYNAFIPSSRKLEDTIKHNANLVAYWPCDNSSGDITDQSSGGTLDGSPTDLTYGGRGSVGNSVSFNGTSSKVEIPDDNSIEGLAQVTVMFWFKTGTLSSFEKLFHKPGVYDIGLNDSGFLFAELNGVGNLGTITGGETDDDVWHMFALTYDGSTMEAYIDGTSNESLGSLSGSLGTSSNVLGIGYHVSNNNEYFSGQIQHIAIFNSALSSGDITNIYNAAGIRE